MKKISLIIASVLVSTMVQASDVSQFKPKEEVIKRINQFVQLDKFRSSSFAKTSNGLIAIKLVTPNWKKLALFSTNTGDTLINGTVIDTTSGKNLSKKYTEEINIDATAFGQDLEKATGFIQGSGENTIYIAIDVNCGYCHKTWEDMQNEIIAKYSNIKIKWVPVGVLGEPSKQAAIKLASIEDNEIGVQAIANYMNRKSFNEPYTTNGQGEEKSSENLLILKKNGLGGGVPIVVSHIDGKWQVPNGKPSADFYQQLARNSNTTLVKKKAEKIAKTSTARNKHLN